MEKKLKHLEFIQAVINRMSGNSFLLKGWSVTLIAGLFVLSARDSNQNFVALAYLPTVLFWFLDGYFLHQERLYRDLYDSVRLKEEERIDFSLDAHNFNKNKDGTIKWRNTWLISTFWSTTVGFSYFFLIVILSIIIRITIKQ